MQHSTEIGIQQLTITSLPKLSPDLIKIIIVSHWFNCSAFTDAAWPSGFFENSLLFQISSHCNTLQFWHCIFLSLLPLFISIVIICKPSPTFPGWHQHLRDTFSLGLHLTIDILFVFPLSLQLKTYLFSYLTGIIWRVNNLKRYLGFIFLIYCLACGVIPALFFFRLSGFPANPRLAIHYLYVGHVIIYFCHVRL